MGRNSSSPKTPPRAVEFRPLGFHRRPLDTDVFHFADVIEGTDADVAGAKCFVSGDHDRSGHVVEIDLDAAIAEFSFQFHAMPLVEAPGNSFGGFFGDR